MDINKSTIYYNAIPESEENLRIMRRMDEEFLEHPTHGVIQMQDFLFSLNFLVNHKLYLTAIIDVYSRYVVAWDIFNSLDSENSLSVLKNGIARHGKPEIINSDQGSFFTCELSTQYVKKDP